MLARLTLEAREDTAVEARARTSNRTQPDRVSGLSDEQVVALAVSDRSYFRLLYERYADRIYWYAKVRTGSDAAADDIVSETMLAALEGLHRFDPTRGTFAAWLFVIGQRKTVDHQRAHQRILRLVTRMRQRAVPGFDDGALDHLVAEEQAAEVRGLLRGLPAGYQEILALRYSAGLSGEEIATVLDISHSTARKRLSRATRRFSERMIRDETQP
jgi:RNA polymerase sigma-70 factor (ECF subfamily)